MTTPALFNQKIKKYARMAVAWHKKNFTFLEFHAYE